MNSSQRDRSFKPKISDFREKKSGVGFFSCLSHFSRALNREPFGERVPRKIRGNSPFPGNSPGICNEEKRKKKIEVPKNNVVLLLSNCILQKKKKFVILRSLNHILLLCVPQSSVLPQRTKKKKKKQLTVLPLLRVLVRVLLFSNSSVVLGQVPRNITYNNNNNNND